MKCSRKNETEKSSHKSLSEECHDCDSHDTRMSTVSANTLITKTMKLVNHFNKLTNKYNFHKILKIYTKNKLLYI